MKNIIIKIIIIVAIFLFSCQPSKPKLIIATAASSYFAVEELANYFSKKENIEVVVVTGSSGNLTNQILNGAPYDLFFSANIMYPKILFQKGKTEYSPFVYGYGIPVFWSLIDDFDFKESDFLKNEIIHKIVIANPKNSPYGDMAIRFFKDKGLYEELKNKFVFGESISQVNEYILNESVQIGVSARSIVYSPKLKDKGTFLEFPKQYLIPHGFVVVKNENFRHIKNIFFDYLKSDNALEILKKYGYVLY